MIKIVSNRGCEKVRGIINSEVVLFSNCYNMWYPGHNTNPPVFNAKLCLFDYCDSNFIYYWLRPHIFPKVQSIYLNSPAGCLLALTNDFKNTNISITDHYQLTNYFENNPKHRIFTIDEMERALGIFERVHTRRNTLRIIDGASRE